MIKYLHDNHIQDDLYWSLPRSRVLDHPCVIFQTVSGMVDAINKICKWYGIANGMSLLMLGLIFFFLPYSLVLFILREARGYVAYSQGTQVCAKVCVERN